MVIGKAFCLSAHNTAHSVTPCGFNRKSSKKHNYVYHFFHRTKWAQLIPAGWASVPHKMTLGNIAPNYFWWLIFANVPVMSCSPALPSRVGRLADSILLKIDADGIVVICCQTCHTGNNVAEIPVWLANIDYVPNSVLLTGWRHASGPNWGFVDPKVKLRWNWSYGSNRVCAQNTRCAQTGKCSGVTFHWPSRLPRNVAVHEMLKLNSLLVSPEWI